MRSAGIFRRGLKNFRVRGQLRPEAFEEPGVSVNDYKRTQTRSRERTSKRGRKLNGLLREKAHGFVEHCQFDPEAIHVRPWFNDTRASVCQGREDLTNSACALSIFSSAS